MPSFEEFHPNSKAITIASISINPALFLPEQRRGQQDHYNHNRKHDHLRHSRPLKDWIV
jgi:hypothetical protein